MAVNNSLAPFEYFPVDLREYHGEPITNRNGRACPTVMRRPSYGDGWSQPRSGGRIHRAIDIFAPQGSWVIAPLGGVVIKSSRTTGPTPKGGHHIEIKVASGHRLYFSHLRDEPSFAVGDRVPSGAHLGFVGRTGNAARTCPHLHFAVSDRMGRKVNAYSHLVAIDPFRARLRKSAPLPNGQSRADLSCGSWLYSGVCTHSEDDEGWS